MGLYVIRWPNRPLQEFCHSTHDFGNADDFLLDFVVSREREHTLAERRTPLRTLHCIFE